MRYRGDGRRALRFATDELVRCREAVEVPVELVRIALDSNGQEGRVIADSVGETSCVFLAACIGGSARLPSG